MSPKVWETFRSKAFRCTSVDDMVTKASLSTKLKRVLGLLDLVMLGLGSMIGSGVFVVTGEVAHEHTGPAIILSYGLAGIAALFCALVYAEFAADVPVAGASYNYVSLVFGEFASWIAASCFLMECSVSSAAVAKGVAGYFSTLIGIDSNALIITFDSTDAIVIDILGTVVVLFLTVLFAYGVRESFTFNGITTTISLAIMLFVVGASVKNIDTENYAPFFSKEHDTSATFRGASIVFFSYIGFEAMATVSEDSKNPSRDLPFSIIVSVTICTILYILMAAALVGMVPYQEIDVLAAFSSAFETIGWGWASRIVSFGALCGIITSLFGAMYVTSRLLMVLGREGFLPRILAEVNERTSTPINATVLAGLFTAIMTLLLDITTLSSMVSLGTLFVYCLVCAASIWKRYVITTDDLSLDNAENPVHPGWILLRLCLLIIISIIEGLVVERQWSFWLWTASIGLFFVVALSFTCLPVVFQSSTFKLTPQPLISCLGLLCSVHLIMTLEIEAYFRLLSWIVLSILVYVFYSMHHTSEEQQSAQENSPREVDPLFT